MAKKHAHYANARESSNQVASSSNKFLNPRFDSYKVLTSKQVIINRYSSFTCKFLFTKITINQTVQVKFQNVIL
jgi:hypothetical protein